LAAFSLNHDAHQIHDPVINKDINGHRNPLPSTISDAHMRWSGIGCGFCSQQPR